MRINAQLIDGNTGSHLWAERFDGPWEDVFTLQDQVVGGTDNPAAYDLYLRGLELNYSTAPAEAAALYRHAVALDPNFGQAWRSTLRRPIISFWPICSRGSASPKRRS